jgi:hypothetical protein
MVSASPEQADKAGTNLEVRGGFVVRKCTAVGEIEQDAFDLTSNQVVGIDVLLIVPA